MACVSTLMSATYCYGDIPYRDTVVHKHRWIRSRLTSLFWEDAQTSYPVGTCDYSRFSLSDLAPFFGTVKLDGVQAEVETQRQEMQQKTKQQ